MRIGILGGTFNPVHNGHLRLARQVRAKLGLDKVIFVPANTPPHKDDAEIAPARDRYCMVRDAIQGIPGFSVSTIELQRQGKSYTIDTLKAFRRKYKDAQLYFITGSDLIRYLGEWKDFDEVSRLATFVVATRPAYPLESLPRTIFTVTIDAFDISAYQIRRLIRSGSSIASLVPAVVARRINKKHLYSTAIKVAPSVIAADFSVLSSEIKRVERAGADMLHVDVMDGHFVDNITLGPCVVEAIRRTTKLPLETHLMIDNPLRFIERFAQAGADIITVHIETITKNDFKVYQRKLAKRKVRLGISLNPATPVSAIQPLLSVTDMVLVMSVNPGFGGQKFIPSVLGKIKKLRECYSGDIAVDGGINDLTAPLVTKAGANILASGTYIFHASDAAHAIRRLRYGHKS